LEAEKKNTDKKRAGKKDLTTAWVGREGEKEGARNFGHNQSREKPARPPIEETGGIEKSPKSRIWLLGKGGKNDRFWEEGGGEGAETV